MKNTLLSLIFSIGAFALIAQTPLQKQLHRMSNENKFIELRADESMEFPGEFNEFVSNMKAPDVVIGNCRYDRQSNYSVQQRMFVYPDGTIGATWMRGMEETSYPDRGTGYNYFNGTTWGPAPTERIESVKTGWPSYAPFGANGEIVAAHTANATGLVFSWRENKGTGEWNSFTFAGPDGLDLLYPRIVTNGPDRETIHLIAQVRATTPYAGLAGALTYSRSSDGGQTWEILHEVLQGIDSDHFLGFGADRFAFADPVGETLAFVTGDGYSDVVVMKSTDNGDNWDRIDYYLSPDPFMDGNTEIPRYGAVDSFHSIVIDDMGQVHVSSGRRLNRADGLGGLFYFPYSNGLIYWNENMPPLDSTMVGSDISDPSAVPSQYLLAELFDNGVDSIIGVATYYGSITTMPQLVFDHETKFLYAFYSALTLGFATDEYNYRHIWMKYSEDYGQTWSPEVDLTGDIFHLFSECVFPSASPTLDDKIHLIYQSDDAPGMAASGVQHTVRDNTIVYLTVNTAVGVNEQLAHIVSIDQISPNPANDFARIVVNVDRAVPAQISIINTIGQSVYQSDRYFTHAGPHQVEIALDNLESGVYFIRVKAGNDVAVQKLIVQ